MGLVWVVIWIFLQARLNRVTTWLVKKRFLVLRVIFTGKLRVDSLVDWTLQCNAYYRYLPLNFCSPSVPLRLPKPLQKIPLQNSFLLFGNVWKLLCFFGGLYVPSINKVHNKATSSHMVCSKFPACFALKWALKIVGNVSSYHCCQSAHVTLFLLEHRFQ